MFEKEWLELLKNIKSLDNDIEITVCCSDEDFSEKSQKVNLK